MTDRTEQFEIDVITRIEDLKQENRDSTNFLRKGNWTVQQQQLESQKIILRRAKINELRWVQKQLGLATL